MKPYQIYETLTPTIVIDLLCMIRHMLEVVDKFKQAAQRAQKDVPEADIFTGVQGKWRREDLATMRNTLLTVKDLSKLFLPACERAILDIDRANREHERLQKLDKREA